MPVGDVCGPSAFPAGNRPSRLVALNRDDIQANQDLAIRVMRRGAPHDAETHARNAVRIAPLDPQSHNVMAMVLTEASKPHAAEVHYRRAMALVGRRRDPVVLSNHALCLRMQGRLDEARALCAESATGVPREAKIPIDWARLEEADGRANTAAALADRAAALSPDHAAFHRAYLHATQ